MKDNDSKTNKDTFIKVILKLVISALIIWVCVYLINLGLEAKANMENELYINNKLEYNIEIKDLDENNNIINVLISNKGDSIVNISDGKLVVYKYTNASSNIYRQSKLFELYPTMEKNCGTIFLSENENINIQFKVPKEINNEDYYVDFDAQATIDDTFVNIERFFVPYTT